MTPEAYIAAVKSCPRTAWIDDSPLGSGHLQYGYAVAMHYAEIAGRVVGHGETVVEKATGFHVDLRSKLLFDPSNSQPLSVLVSVVPDSILSATGVLQWLSGLIFHSRNTDLRHVAKWSSGDRLCGSKDVWIEQIFLKTVPTRRELHAYFMSKYGRPEKARRMEDEAAKELINKQHDPARKQVAEQRRTRSVGDAIF